MDENKTPNVPWMDVGKLVCTARMLAYACAEDALAIEVAIRRIVGTGDLRGAVKLANDSKRGSTFTSAEVRTALSGLRMAMLKIDTTPNADTRIESAYRSALAGFERVLPPEEKPSRPTASAR